MRAGIADYLVQSEQVAFRRFGVDGDKPLPVLYGLLHHGRVTPLAENLDAMSHPKRWINAFPRSGPVIAPIKVNVESSENEVFVATHDSDFSYFVRFICNVSAFKEGSLTAFGLQISRPLEPRATHQAPGDVGRCGSRTRSA
jgi:hypothetical protein